MNRPFVVMEGELDLVLLRNYLPAEMLHDLRFYVCQGRMSPLTAARNILFHEGGTVMVIMDADTSEPSG